MQWITVPCDRKFERALVLCETTEVYIKNYTDGLSSPGQQNVTIRLKRNNMECPYEWVQIAGNCYRMLDLGAPRRIINCRDMQTICRAFNGRPAIYRGKESFLPYFKQWLSNPYKGQFYIAQDNENDSCVSKSFLETQSPMMTLSDTDSAQGRYVLCEQDPIVAVTSCLENQYSCVDGTCILDHHQCDGIPDCPDSSDEISCDSVCTNTDSGTISGSRAGNKPLAPGTECFEACFKETCHCSDLYFHCEATGMCVPASKLCDGVTDCQQEEDEFFCDNQDMERTDSSKPSVPISMAETPFTSCAKQRTGSNFYLPMHKVCLFERNSDGYALKYCPNGEHLQFCTNHQCPSDHKCPQSYCIPYHYVCNGRADCPYGEDEYNCALSCPGLLRCRKDNVCIHTNYVGDSVVDCVQSRDDEILSDVRICQGNSNCSCLGRAMSCPFSNLKDLPVAASHFKTLMLAGNSITAISGASIFPYLLILNLSQNRVKSLVSLNLERFPKLLHLILDHNCISMLSPNDFFGPNYLTLLSLKNNSIKTIKRGVFKGLWYLSTLDLSQNSLRITSPLAFDGIRNSLRHLYFRRNTVTDSFIASINRLPNLYSVFVDKATLCPYIPQHIQCKFSENPYSSCCRLINSNIFSILIWALASVGMSLSTLCLFFFTFTHQPITTKIASMTLHASDLTMSCYFLSMASLNTYYQRMFLFYQDKVTHGLLCQALASIAFVVDGIAQVGIVLSCFQRLYVVAWPFKDPKSPFKVYSIVLAISLLLMIFVLVGHALIRGSGSLISIPCVVIPVSDWKAPHSLYLLLCYLLFQSSTCIASAVLTILSLRKLRAPDSLNLRQSRRNGLKEAAYRRNCVVITSVTLNLALVCISQGVVLHIEADTTIMIIMGLLLYSRSLINPILYTLTTQNFIHWVSDWRRCRFLMRS